MSFLSKLIFVSNLLFLTVGCAGNDPTKNGVEAYEAGNYEVSYAELKPLSKDGDRIAQFYMGKMYYSGQGVKKDWAVAIDYYKKSADQGFSKAQNNLGMMYLNGESVARNAELGFQWIAKAADQDLVIAQIHLGVALTYEGSPLSLDRVRGLHYLEAAASQNDPNAITKLGGYYADIDKNHKKAGELFERAAGMGDAEAMHRLHFTYMSGFNRDVDKKEGFNLLQRAAAKNYIWAFYDLSQAYIWGNGTDQDVEQGYLWATRAANQANDYRAMEGLAQMMLNLRDAYLARVENLGSISSGIKWREKAASMGYVGAQLNLYQDLYFGTYGPIDKSTAMNWLKAAAEQGSVDACWELGRQYLNGWDLPVNYDAGIAQLTRSAEGGLYKAMLALGTIYYAGGYDVPKDNVAALTWLQKVPTDYWQQQMPDLYPILLGRIYSERRGVLDRSLAEKWFKKSEAPEASLLLANLFYNKRYGSPDLEKVIGYASASESSLEGPARALTQALLSQAFFINKDLQSSLYWAEQSFQLGSSSALEALAIDLIYGININKDLDKAVSLLRRIDRSGSALMQITGGMLYLKGSLGLGLGQGVNVDLSKSDYWLSMAEQTIGSGSEYQEDLAKLKAELKTAQYEVRKRKDIQRAERLKQKEKLERKQLALQRNQEEYKRLIKLQAKRQKGPSFAEVLIGAVFQAVGEGIASGVKAKIHQELGVRNYDPNARHEEHLDDIGKRARREARRVIRMEKIQKNLRTQPSIGYQY